MPYIYKITNSTNGKVYIGKTNTSVSTRWDEHCQNRYRFRDRPLYRAMNKYGPENFQDEAIEQVADDDAACMREIYWIEYFRSFKEGYNATMGGDGKAYIDRDIVLSLFNEGRNIKQIGQIMGHSRGQIGNILRDMNDVSAEAIKSRGHDCRRKIIAQLDIATEEILQVFASVSDAARSIGKQDGSHISSVCKGSRNTAYGFKWKYLNQ